VRSSSCSSTPTGRKATRLSTHPRPDPGTDGTATATTDRGYATVRFWAAARQAAGHAEEPSRAATIGELRAELARRAELTRLVEMASFLIDGVQAGNTTPINAGAVVDVLPPFAGG
jgi:molybdopterin converting factor small subunit